MNKIFSILYLMLFTTTMLLVSSNDSYAHFGSKGLTGGSVSCAITYDTVAYIGTYTGGVYISANSQLATWTPRPVGLKDGRITALAHTGSYLFAATKDSGIFRFTGFIGNDRYWEKVNNGLTNFNITSLLAIDSITIIAGTTGDGVFITNNKGASWTTANTNMLHYDVNGFTKAGTRIIQISDGGLWASDDSAKTWFDFTDVTTDDEDATAVSYNSTTDELLVLNDLGLYSLASASTTGSPAYLSASTGLPSNTVVRFISNNGTTWYLATDKGVYTSPTGTISWTGENTGIPTEDVTAILTFQTRVVAGTNHEGIFKTPASSISWAATNTGFNNLATYSALAKDTVMVVAANEKGVFVSSNLATSYVRSNTGLTDSLNVTDLAWFGTTLLATTQNEGIFMSADTGKSWTVFNTNLSDLHINKVKASLSYVYIINSSYEIWQSDLSGGWAMIQSGLPGGVKPASMAFYSGTILLGTLGDGVYTRPESSGAWTQHNIGLTNTNVTSVTVNNFNKIFAGTDGNGVFISDASSISWSPAAQLSTTFTATIGLDGSNVQDMAYYSGYVFASFRGSVLATANNGTSWIDGGTQFNLPSYSDLNKLSFVTTRIFTSTQDNCPYSNGISELPPLGIENIIEGNTSMLITPNPNNGNFRFSYKNESEKAVEITLNDITGKLVKRFSNASNHNFSVDCAKGIYFLQVTTDKGVHNQKMIVE